MTGQQAAGGRRAALHARTRDEILDAAAELVTEHGVEALNLQDLATRAGFGNAASLYRYFASKQEIVGALAARGLERLGEHLRSVPDDLPPEEQIVEFCLAYLEYARPPRRAAAAAHHRREHRARLPRRGASGRVRGSHVPAGRGGARERHPQRAATRDDVFAILHAGWALAHGMAEYDSLYEDPERGLLRNRHRAVFKAYVAGFGSDWTD